jgi:hypothetical protein
MPKSAELVRIEKQIRCAIRRRIAVNASCESVASGAEADISTCKTALSRHCRRYCKQLRRVSNAYQAKNKGQLKAAKTVVEESFSARIMAAVRATDDIEAGITFAELEDIANGLSLSKVYDEALIVHPEAKDKPGEWRTICLSGRRRKMQQLMLRDIWMVTLGDVTHDSSVAGGGGERELFAQLKSAIADGYEYWATFDIRNFFPSLRPGHLAGVPLPKWVKENLVFLPPETTIKFVDPNYHLVLHEQVIFSGDEYDLPDGYPYNGTSIGSKLKTVRQGLIQGDVIAPLIARMVLARELRRLLKDWDVTLATHLDNVLMGARSQADLKASLEALIKRLKSLPAGPLELHSVEIRHIKDHIFHLGYRVSQRKDGSIHVRPGIVRFDRFRRRLLERFENSAAFTRDELIEIGIKYAQCWFRSNRAWDKESIGRGSSKCEGASWDYVVTEVINCVNEFIFKEYLACKFNWHESDMDPEFLEQKGWSDTGKN